MKLTSALTVACTALATAAAAATAATTPPPASRPLTLLEFAGASAAPSALHDSVVLIIDAQREYTGGLLPLADVAAALHQTQRLLERARAAGVPVVHIQQVSPNGRRLFAADGPFVDFAPQARPLPSESVIPKTLPNAFAGTSLADTLQALGRRELILSGYMTHMCVSATARSALDHGYRVTVIADACATRDLPDPLAATAVVPATTVHRAALAALADRFATIVPTLDQIPD